jgi:pimeloyl-ACP methyl ester carboxylesterase
MESLTLDNKYVPVSKFVTLKNKLRIHYIEAGPLNAPTLLLTHGFLGSSTDWQQTISDLISKVSTPLRILAVDWPGFGNSDKPVIAYSVRFFAECLRNFAEALDLKKFYLMGHSMGGKFNLAFTLLYPGYVQKLILIAPDCFTKEAWWGSFAKNGLFKVVSNRMITSLGDPYFLKQFLSRIIFDRRFYPSEKEIREKAHALRQPGQIKALQAMAAQYSNLSLVKTGLHQKLGEISAPTLIIRGSEDKVVSREEIVELIKVLQNPVGYTLKSCGHMAQLEKTEAVNKLVLEFLK